MASIMIYFISHSFSLLLDLVLKIQNETTLLLARFLQLLFPPFEALNIKDYI
jgi:hypothetical protein